MTQQIANVEVVATESGSITACDLRRILADETGYASYLLIPIGEDGYRQPVAAQMIWHAESGRAGIEFGADASWTDATSPEDAAERFFGINGKQMSN